MDKLHNIHFIERKAAWRIHMVQVETSVETNNLKTRQCMAGNVEAYVWCINKKRSKNGPSRNSSSIMPDKYGVSSSLNQMMKNFDKQWKTLVESLQFRCQQQCVVKHQQIAAVKPAAVLGNARPIMLVLWMPTNLWEYDWKEYQNGIIKITSLQKEWIHWVIRNWGTSLFRCLKH